MDNETLTREVFSLKAELKESELRAKSNTHRIDKHEDEIKMLSNKQDAIYELASSVKILANDMTNIKDTISLTNENIAGIKKTQGDIQKELNEVKEVPQKRDADTYKHIRTKVVDYAIMLVLGALAVYFGLN